MAMKLELEHINLKYNDLEVFKDFSIEFVENEINCILGPSGCGKTSLLNIISDLLKPDKISVNSFENKIISYVFQEPRLLPWKTVSDNISFVLKDKIEEFKIKSRVEEYLEMVRLHDFRDFYPGQLSGGMKQRVSLARAFSFPSDVILMDEPFKGLDIKLKKDLSDAFQTLWNHRKVTVIWVSHDVEEALVSNRYCYILKGSPAKIAESFFTREENVDENRRLMMDLLGK